MSNVKIFVLGTLISAGFAFGAIAETDKSERDQTDMEAPSGMKKGHDGGKDGMMGGDHRAMMQSMMKMHAKMMGGHANGMGMMDRDIMTMMMADGDRQNIGPHMAAKVKEFDTDGDGNLSLEEFETMHADMMRDRMVDRFQHLDSDGDGQVTEQEIEAAAMRMTRMNDAADDDDTTEHHGDDTE